MKTTKTRWIRLEHYGFLDIVGSKAESFLQGQLTCNVSEATRASPIPGAYCTPKGRVISNFLLSRPAEDCWRLRLRADVIDAMAEVLRKYGVFSRVSISVPTQCPLIVGVLGEAPAISDTCIAVYGDSGLYETWIDPVLGAATAVETDATPWRVERLRRGKVDIGAACSDQFLPNMLGYTDDGTVHFRKGCYTGQEIVARAHYRGAVKRHLQAVTGSDLAPPDGSELLGGQRSLGAIVEAVTVDAGWAGLAVLADSGESTEMHLSDGRAVTLSADHMI